MKAIHTKAGKNTVTVKGVTLDNPDGLNLSVFTKRALVKMRRIDDIFKQAAYEQGKPTGE
jgi:hypothetical protein